MPTKHAADTHVGRGDPLDDDDDGGDNQSYQAGEVAEQTRWPVNASTRETTTRETHMPETNWSLSTISRLHQRPTLLVRNPSRVSVTDLLHAVQGLTLGWCHRTWQRKP